MSQLRIDELASSDELLATPFSRSSNSNLPEIPEPQLKFIALVLEKDFYRRVESVKGFEIYVLLPNFKALPLDGGWPLTAVNKMEMKMKVKPLYFHVSNGKPASRIIFEKMYSLSSVVHPEVLRPPGTQHRLFATGSMMYLEFRMPNLVAQVTRRKAFDIHTAHGLHSLVVVKLKCICGTYNIRRSLRRNGGEGSPSFPGNIMWTGVCGLGIIVRVK
ncbi:hypothetical protein C8F04DRAFT_1181493 [Mycena alexandri]|uniref:Uncharacterized protein n=1 Tax=Mycena alexandri TaxID=1745969 RepID=A0AAD6X4C1_9AGAR|nr:hypothetical protein C8F04DRAFT_1181493 [Mycena alexandri]